MGKDPEQKFSKKDIQKARRHSERIANITNHQEMQIQPTTRYLSLHTRQDVCYRTKVVNPGEDLGKRKPCTLLVGMCVGAAKTWGHLNVRPRVSGVCEVGRQVGRWVGRQVDRQIDAQTDKQIERESRILFSLKKKRKSCHLQHRWNWRTLC